MSLFVPSLVNSTVVGDEVFSVYVHIPFCDYHCSFCDFATVIGRHGRMAAYTDALLAELRLRTCDGPRRTAATIFFGGGTPSTLPVAELQRIMAGLAEALTLADDIEVSLEANPGLPDLASWQALRAAGISRLSIGIQSLDDRVLQAVDRRHSAADAVAALQLARQAGFRSVNADLIYGLPGQDRASWECTLR